MPVEVGTALITKILTSVPRTTVSVEARRELRRIGSIAEWARRAGSTAAASVRPVPWLVVALLADPQAAIATPIY
jgi:hypothetical protein